jgi:hypothetical protein
VYQLDLGTIAAAIASTNSTPVILRKISSVAHLGPCDGFNCPSDNNPFAPNPSDSTPVDPAPPSPNDDAASDDDDTVVSDANANDDNSRNQDDVIIQPAVIGLVTGVASLLLVLFIIVAVTSSRGAGRDVEMSEASSAEPSPLHVGRLVRDGSRVSERMFLEQLIDQVTVPPASTASTQPVYDLASKSISDPETSISGPTYDLATSRA